MADRLSAARDYVAKKPTDRFGLYTLAMELRKVQAWEECFATFDRLLAVGRADARFARMMQAIDAELAKPLTQV
jgi:hypothetical protein